MWSGVVLALLIQPRYCSGATVLLENFNDDAIDEMFYHFPLFDEPLRHKELSNSVISQIQPNPPKLF